MDVDTQDFSHIQQELHSQYHLMHRDMSWMFSYQSNMLTQRVGFFYVLPSLFIVCDFHSGMITGEFHKFAFQSVIFYCGFLRCKLVLVVK